MVPPITNGSLVILDIECSGTDIPESGGWIDPLTFSFPEREVIHFKVRDSGDFRKLIHPALRPPRNQR